MDAHPNYVLGLADDALVSAQRTGWWISRAPELEEDVALANIGLDQLGQARSLLAHAGALEGHGRGEDELAYWRDERDFLCVHLVERAQDDFGVAMARLLVFATYQAELYAALLGSADPTLAGVAGKAVKEVAYHVDHATHWVLRLGDGTDESHDRMQRALDAEWPYVEELFEPVDPGLLEAGIAADPAALRPRGPGPARDRARRGHPGGARGDAPSRWWASRPAHRGARLRAGRDAAPRPLAPGCALVSPQVRSRAWALAAEVPDPEIPVVTIEDLGILRDVTEDDRGWVHVQVTPTYSGCPAMDVIAGDVVDRLTRAGYQHVDVEHVLAPAWSTDDISEAGRAKLAAYGIAPPQPTGPPRHGGPVTLALSVRCPQCGSPDTRESSRFGSTACKSLWVCRSCREPFDHFKAL